MLNFGGRWITRNGTLVAVHKMEGQYDGELEQWYGHTIPFESETRLTFTWNPNGECMRAIGASDNVNNWDLMESISGKDLTAAKMKVEGCKECEE